MACSENGFCEVAVDVFLEMELFVRFDLFEFSVKYTKDRIIKQIKKITTTKENPRWGMRLLCSQ